MRRRRGEGTVYLRRDGRWSGQVRRPGGRRQTVYGRTQEEAAERVAALRESTARPNQPVPPPSLDVLRRNAAAIRRIARRAGASNPRVFGSVARGEAGPESDYDLIVDLDEHLRGFEAFYRLDRLEEALRELLGRPVHVVTARHQSEFTRKALGDAVAL